MDTISRENNSMLPVAGVVVGVLGLLIGGYAAISLSKVNKTLAEHQTKIEKIDAVESTANNAVSKVDGLSRELAQRVKETQAGFDQIGPILVNLQASVTKLEEAAKKPVVADKGGKKGDHGPVVAGPGEYVVKKGDGGAAIARANGVSLADLQAVNPGVNWTKLAVGQKIKLPAKK